MGKSMGKSMDNQWIIMMIFLMFFSRRCSPGLIELTASSKADGMELGDPRWCSHRSAHWVFIGSIRIHMDPHGSIDIHEISMKYP